MVCIARTAPISRFTPADAAAVASRKHSLSIPGAPHTSWYPVREQWEGPDVSGNRGETALRLSRLLRLVLERQLDLGPVQQFPGVTDDDVLFGHLGHSDITHGSPRRGDGLSRRVLPGRGTRPDHIDHPVHAHDDLSFHSR